LALPSITTVASIVRATNAGANLPLELPLASGEKAQSVILETHGDGKLRPQYMPLPALITRSGFCRPVY
jgi:hypothetical protein